MRHHTQVDASLAEEREYPDVGGGKKAESDQATTRTARVRQDDPETSEQAEVVRRQHGKGSLKLVPRDHRHCMRGYRAQHRRALDHESRPGTAGHGRCYERPSNAGCEQPAGCPATRAVNGRRRHLARRRRNADQGESTDKLVEPVDEDERCRHNRGRKGERDQPSNAKREEHGQQEGDRDDAPPGRPGHRKDRGQRDGQDWREKALGGDLKCAARCGQDSSET